MGDYNKAANGEQAGEPLWVDQLENNELASSSGHSHSHLALARWPTVRNPRITVSTVSRTAARLCQRGNRWNGSRASSPVSITGQKPRC